MHPIDFIHKTFNSGGFVNTKYNEICLETSLYPLISVYPPWKINTLVFSVEKGLSRLFIVNFIVY